LSRVVSCVRQGLRSCTRSRALIWTTARAVWVGCGAGSSTT